MKKTRFFTIFPRTQNLHLIKDVGMVPYILKKYYDYDSTIATYKNDFDYPYLDKEVKGLKIDFIERKFKNSNLNLMLYILKNFKKIDILQFYHFEINQLDLIGLYVLLRKLFFKKSFTYIKCDGSSRFTDTDFKHVRFKFLRKLIIKNIDLYTIETAQDYSKIKSISDYQMINLRIMANGFYNYKAKDESKVKEKTFLFVGRVGSSQKNVELLVQAFVKFNKINKDWKLVLVGKNEGDFKTFLHNTFESNLGISDYIENVGEISNREQLDSYYESSKVFVLPSRYESFGISCIEALSWGCQLILSDEVPLQKEFEENEDVVFFKNDNLDDLVEKLIFFSKTDCTKKNVDDNIRFAYKHFYWPNLVNVIIESYEKSR